MALISVFFRMGMGIVTFIAIARFLGPLQFGVFASAIAYGGLLNLLSDFGMGTYALRSAGAKPQATPEILWRAIAVKLAMASVVTVGAGACLQLFASDWSGRSIYVIVYVGTLIASFGDLLFISARANDRFDIEAFVVVVTSIISLGIVIATAFLTKNVLWVSFAFLGTRCLYLGISAVAVLPWLRTGARQAFGMLTILSEARKASYFAVDTLVTNLSSQIDVIVLSLIMSPHALGIYQAGARLVQGITPFGVMLSQVYLPRLSKAVAESDNGRLRQLASRLNLEMFAVGLCGFLGFQLIGPIWTRQVYGEAFSELIPLWPGLACFVLLRFCSSSFGIQLVAVGEIKVRIGAQILATLTIIGFAPVVYYFDTIALAPWMIAISSLVVLIIYGVKVTFAVGNRKSVLIVAAATTIVCMAAAAIAGVNAFSE